LLLTLGLHWPTQKSHYNTTIHIKICFFLKLEICVFLHGLCLNLVHPPISPFHICSECWHTLSCVFQTMRHPKIWSSHKNSQKHLYQTVWPTLPLYGRMRLSRTLWCSPFCSRTPISLKTHLKVHGTSLKNE
jgi:hypothetical protein